MNHVIHPLSCAAISIFHCMMSAKLGSPGLLKIKIFQNKGGDSIILDYHVITKFYLVTQIIL